MDDTCVKVVDQSPDYPMQFMLNIYEFADGADPVSPVDHYPKVFAVDRFRGWRRVSGPGARPAAFASAPDGATQEAGVGGEGSQAVTQEQDLALQ